MLSRAKKIFGLTGIKVGLLATIVSLLIYAVGFPFLNVMELKAYDLHFRSRGAMETSGQVAIVAIDEKSLDELGRWPWSRSRIAALVEKLDKYGAAVIAFDIIFPEPDESSGVTAIRRVKERFIDDKNGVLQTLERLEKEADNDARLAAAINASPSTILGYFFHTSRDDIKHLAEESTHPRIAASPYSMVRYLTAGASAPLLPAALGIEENIEILSASAADFGFFNVIPDMDGAIRWVPLVFEFDKEPYPHLSVQSVRKYLGSPQMVLNVAEYGVDSISIGEWNMGTDETGRMLINYRGPRMTFPHYSAVDVIAARVPVDAMRDKIVLIGATATGIYDMRVTPFESTFPAVEIHANAIDNMLLGDFMYRPDWVALFDVLAIVVLGLLLSVLIPRIRAAYSAVLTIAIAGVYTAFNSYAFNALGLWLGFVYPLLAVFLVSAVVTTFQFMTEERKRREIRGAFSRYVSPELVNVLMKEPEKLILGGEEKRLTVLFSDIRGFTAISEGLTPQRLVKLMNEYLTPMTDIIMKHGGTVDKYMGDAIMAFWGAPVWQEEHPVMACSVALEMLEKLNELQPVWREQGIPQLDIGIGISTGKATVGNMGSFSRFDYTIIGDSVNLGSRLEGINKEYGTRIIVPKYTYEDVKHEFTLREIDRVKVKGKELPITIYELMGGKKDEDKLKELKSRFERGLNSYRLMDWSRAQEYFESCLELSVVDGPARIFLSRVEALRDVPPPPDWDGVYVMTRK